ncbi:MAG: site-2 protease family protein [Leptolyngbyaceae bacterium]|nr:site-2 protease family protein [Leptolyngbyaceae bacterium]
MVIVTGLIAILGILGWGLYRSLPLGRLGVLAWLQSLAIALPLLMILGAFILGVVFNLVTVLILVLVGTGIYIGLGRTIRISGSALSQTENPLDPSSQSSLTDGRDPTPSPMEPSQNFQPEEQSQGELPTSKQKDFQRKTPNLSTSSIPGGQLSDLESSNETAPKKTTIRRIPDSDLQQIQTIFSLDTFFAIENSLYYNGVLFKGNLRGEAETVFQTLSRRLFELVGNRYRLFLIADPQSKPIVLVFPQTNDPVPSTKRQWLLSLFLLGGTIVTCMMAAAIFQGFDLMQSWERWPDTLFLVVGIGIILGGHELGHWVLANRYDLRLSPPFFLPAWQIGSFGVLTRFESVIPHRTALFDVAFAGPAIGGVISLFLFVLGLSISHQGSAFQLSPSFFQSSILVGVLARAVLGNSLLQDIVDIDPLVIVGWLGLLITAINLMPIGQLDGGRIVQAIYGRKVTRWTSIVTLIVLAIATLFNPLALYWMIIILFLQRQLEQPQQNELTEPNDVRAALALLALFVMAAMLLPLSPVLASRLGIGG